VAALRRARDEGLLSIPTIAAQSFPGEPAQAAIAGRYLRDNIKYDLGEREEAGLRRFYELALEIGLVEKSPTIGFYSED
jgi:chorismate dehydratase